MRLNSRVLDPNGTAVCRDCNIAKPKLRAFSSGSQYVYHDDKGRVWNGRRCPPCHGLKATSYRSNYYEKEKAQGMHYTPRGKYVKVTDAFLAEGAKLRPCKECGVMNVNYYHCSTCLHRMKSTGSSALAEAEFFHGR